MQGFQALSDPTRFTILNMLARKGSLAAGDIAREFSITPPAISQHLKVLKNAKLVSVTTKAQQRIYSLNPEGLDDMEAQIDRLRNIWAARFDALDKLLEIEMKKTQSKANDRKKNSNERKK